MDVVVNLAGSQTLRLQIEQGATVDVFVSASVDHMSALEKAQLMRPSTLLAENELVVAVPTSNPANVQSFADLPRAKRLVVGSMEVPVGKYTQTLLERAGTTLGPQFRAEVESHIVSREANVRLVLAKVELGEADAAVVYRTDLVAARNVRAIPLPAELTERTRYPMAIAVHAPEPELAARWIAFAKSPEGRGVLLAPVSGAAVTGARRAARVWAAPGPVLGTGLFLFLAAPFVALLLSSTPAELMRSLSHPLVGPALWLSAWTTALSLLIVVCCGAPLAWLFARSRASWVRVVETCVELPIAAPPAVVGIALLQAFGRRGLFGSSLEVLGGPLPFTSAAVVVAQVIVSAPFFVQTAAAGFRRVDEDMLLVARTLGATPERAFFRIAVPVALPSLLGGAALCWARSLGEFGATLLFAGIFPAARRPCRWPSTRRSSRTSVRHEPSRCSWEPWRLPLCCCSARCRDCWPSGASKPRSANRLCRWRM